MSFELLLVGIALCVIAVGFCFFCVVYKRLVDLRYKSEFYTLATKVASDLYVSLDYRYGEIYGRDLTIRNEIYNALMEEFPEASGSLIDIVIDATMDSFKDEESVVRSRLDG